jgi:hypothetical protein
VRALDHLADEPIGSKALAFERLDADHRDMGMTLPYAVELDLELEFQVGIDDDGDAGSKLCIRERSKQRTNGAASPVDARKAKCAVDDAGREMSSVQTSRKLSRERRARRTVARCEHEDQFVARLDRVEPATIMNAVQHATQLRRRSPSADAASPQRHHISTDR